MNAVSSMAAPHLLVMRTERGSTLTSPAYPRPKRLGAPRPPSTYRRLSEPFATF